MIAAYEAPFPTADSRAGAAQFPLLVPTQDDAVGAEEMRAVADALSRWEKPALVAFSDSDPVFPHPKSGQVFWDLIPGARSLVTISWGAHFLQWRLLASSRSPTWQALRLLPCLAAIRKSGRCRRAPLAGGIRLRDDGALVAFVASLVCYWRWKRRVYVVV